jgi:inorganic triphosphatase YgiF
MELEVESKLAISTGQEEDVFSILQKEGRFGPFKFLHGIEARFHDVYFDTNNTGLYHRGVYLRVRLDLMTQEVLLTLRGFTAIGVKILQVSEVNGPATAGSIDSVLTFVGRFFQVDKASIPKFDRYDLSICSTVFNKIGLKSVLELDNFRMEYDLINEGDKIGKMSFDRVVFDIRGKAELFAEIEIKLRSDYASVLDHLFAELVREYGPYFEATSQTKLQRGISLIRTRFN